MDLHANTELVVEYNGNIPNKYCQGQAGDHLIAEIGSNQQHLPGLAHILCDFGVTAKKYDCNITFHPSGMKLFRSSIIFQILYFSIGKLSKIQVKTWACWMEFIRFYIIWTISCDFGEINSDIQYNTK